MNIQEKLSYIEENSRRIGELNYEINSRYKEFKRLKTEKDIHKYLLRMNKQSKERRLVYLRHKDISYLLNEYSDCIDWKLFSYIYLKELSFNRRNYIGELKQNKLDIINNEKFVISSLYLIEDRPVLDLCYILPPDRITEIIEVLLRCRVSSHLILYKVYQALNFYFPNDRFWMKVFNYKIDLESNKKAYFKKKIGKDVSAKEILSKEFNINLNREKLGKYLFMFFHLAKTGKTFEEISELLSGAEIGKLIGKFSASYIVDNFSEYSNEVMRNYGNDFDISGFNKFYRESIKRIIKKIENKEPIKHHESSDDLSDEE